ncbi:hypothetical protein D9M68_986080 [compost metagenome]
MLAQELLRVLRGLPGLVAVVQGDQLQPSLRQAAGLVDLLEVGQRALADVVAEFGIAAGERGRLADDDVLGQDGSRGEQQRAGEHAHGEISSFVAADRLPQG